MTDIGVLQTAVKALKVLRIVSESGRGLSMTDISKISGMGTTITFRILKTLEVSGFIQKQGDSKRYETTVGQTGAAPLASALQLLQHLSSAPLEGIEESRLMSDAKMSLPQFKAAMHDLEQAHLVAPQPNNHWTISPGILGYARGILQKDPTLAALRPIMRSLSETTGETLTWFRITGNEQTIVETIPSSKAISYTLPTGSRFPLYQGAGGKAHLSGMSQDEVSTYVSNLTSGADNPGDFVLDALLTELAEIRVAGYATSQSERVESAAAVAAPIYGPDGHLAGVLGIMAPAFRMPQDRAAQLGEQLV